MNISDEYMNNLNKQADGLIGGMALPNGVLFMSTHGVGVGYHDRKGQLHSLSRPLDPARMRRIGTVGALLWMLMEWGMMLFSLWTGVLGKEERKALLSGLVIGFLGGMALKFTETTETAFNNKMFFYGLLALVILVVLLVPGLRYRLQEVRRYHGAEHQLVHAVGLGETPSQESLARQTVFHPLCGTSAVVPMLPLLPIGLFLPWWGHLLYWPLFFLVLFGASRAANKGDRRAWARLWMRAGEWGQGFTTAPTETRHREAAVAAWEALRACYGSTGQPLTSSPA